MKNKDWLQLINRATEHFRTPFFLFSHLPVVNQLKSISEYFEGQCAYNWLSLKTLPFQPLLKWWLSTGLGVEVTSEYELLAAREEGFPPERIIVNGVAKHVWNNKCWIDRLRVNFDSIREIELLAHEAKRHKWRIGVRFHPSVQEDPENPGIPDQFGISTEDFKKAISILNYNKIIPDTVHIHLRSNIPNVSFYRKALSELEYLVKQTNLVLKCLDLGGGLPAENVTQLDHAWESTYTKTDLIELLNLCHKKFSTVREIIFENGRHILTNCGVLVLTVNDIKKINGFSYLICDGGRTNHALLSDWERHEVRILPVRNGPRVLTAVCGPTCMAYDCIMRCKLPNNIEVGDNVIWFNAGAYNLPWETRFSQPLARLLWHDEQNNIIETRPKESFAEWWEARGSYETHNS